MPDEHASYTFLSFVRRGIAASLHGVDTLGAPGSAPLLNAPTMPVTLRVSRDSRPVTVNARPYGPGDVIGIDARAVIRTEPPAFATDFEPNYLVAIDFDTPDFPWLFTPAAADAQGKLRPWVCLVVVQRSNADIQRSERGCTLRCPRSELPNLAESWAWAHAQVTGLSQGEDPESALVKSSELNLSRLVCPRKLEPRTPYVALVVPAFEAGREAGLGLPITSGELRPAWMDEAEITLPVYYHWEFGTGAAGDFESLVRLLQPHALPAEVGLRAMDVRTPGLGLPSAGDTLGLEGALRTPSTRPTPWPDAARESFQQALRAMLNSPAQRLASAPDASHAPPLVAPPIYGGGQAGATSLEPSSPAWLRELNLDPRHRAAAGFGAMVVQSRQEQLMASAWEQLGDIERANQLLRQAQLARAVGVAIHEKRLAKMRADLLVQVTGPAHARMLMDGESLRHQVRKTALPEAATLASFRRVVRPRGPIARRLLGAGDRSMLVRRLASRAVMPARAREAPAGMVSPDAVSASLRATPPPGRGPRSPNVRFEEATMEAVRVATLRGRLEPGSRPPRRGAPAADTGAVDERFRAAAMNHQARVMNALAIASPAAKPAFDIDQARPKVLAELDPRATLRDRMRSRIDIGAGSTWEREDPLSPIAACPSFQQPMIEGLQEVSQDLVLPGLERVPCNAITLVQPNARFIEAYMAGLNHEMSRELLWREFPAPARCTYFRRFWDVGADSDTPGDVPALRDWHDDLGEHLTGVASDRLIVLLVRGELLSRYPGTTIHAVKARWSGDHRSPGDEEREPLFHGRLDPDIAFVGFGFSLEDARGSDDPAGDAGWYFVLQQQPTEPRFGFDADTPLALEAVKQWNDLAWPHVLAGQLSATAPHISLEVARLKALAIDPDVSWATNSAHMARISLQHPVRIAVHASTMLANLGTA